MRFDAPDFNAPGDGWEGAVVWVLAVIGVVLIVLALTGNL
jgi:hypothetical protein